jgi:PTS system ascorbate-specific IIA component
MPNLIFIIAHAPLASALRDCVAHVFAERMDKVLALDIEPDASVAQSLTQAQNLLLPFGAAPLLLLTDVMGATPCNVARQLLSERTAHLLAGVNLPMLWRAVAYQQETLDVLMDKALNGGVQGILQVDAKIAQVQNTKGEQK